MPDTSLLGSPATGGIAAAATAIGVALILIGTWVIWRRCGGTRKEQRGELAAHDVEIKDLSGCQLPSVTWELHGDSLCLAGPSSNRQLSELDTMLEAH